MRYKLQLLKSNRKGTLFDRTQFGHGLQRWHLKAGDRQRPGCFRDCKQGGCEQRQELELLKWQQPMCKYSIKKYCFYS